MKVLVADDNPGFLYALEAELTRWGYEPIVANNGQTAWQVLEGDDAPPLAILDWMMPGLNGPELCTKIRELAKDEPPYLILLTARMSKEDTVQGLQAGADDYVTKPVDFHELQARVHTGQRIVTLQQHLARRVRELEQALAQVRQLQGLLPICAYCKKIRDDQNYWQQVETYISTRADVRFSHAICPDCLERIVKPEIARLQGKSPSESV
jgi:DNA-binding response OmpR family regulator